MRAVISLNENYCRNIQFLWTNLFSNFTVFLFLFFSRLYMRMIDYLCASYISIWLWGDILPYFSTKSTSASSVNSEIFTRILFSRIALKHIFLMLKFMTSAWFIYRSKGQNDFFNSWGFYFHNTSQMRSFIKNKILAKISEFTIYTDIIWPKFGIYIVLEIAFSRQKCVQYA